MNDGHKHNDDSAQATELEEKKLMEAKKEKEEQEKEEKEKA